jgi:hypothetical protein
LDIQNRPYADKYTSDSHRHADADTYAGPNVHTDRGSIAHTDEHARGVTDTVEHSATEPDRST